MTSRNFLAPVVAVALMLGLASPGFAQSPWRTIAEQVPAGSVVKVRLASGQTFSAVLVRPEENSVLLQPRTRQPVPVQTVRYDAIVSMERVDGRGVGVGKAVAIGAAVGGAAFLGLLMAVVSAWD